MRAFGSANAWLDPANTIIAAKAETRNRTRRVRFMTAAHRLIAELSSGTLHAASDVAGGSGPSTRFASATPISALDRCGRRLSRAVAPHSMGGQAPRVVRVR